MKAESKILILYTGGTIGMVHDLATGALKPFDFEHIVQRVPELTRFNAQIDSYSFPTLFDSSNMQPEVWLSIARKIFSEYNNYDGFVVLHGSDTMAYTASALSFMLENLSKPIVMTGSQLPIGEVRTDAKENLITAIEIASCKHPVVPEVCILFDYQLYRGNRATKYSSEKFQAFQSVNYPVLAEAGVNIQFSHESILPVPSKELQLHERLDDNIAILKLYPGISKNVVASVLGTPGLRAVILETFGAGNASTQLWFLDLLKKAVEKQILLFDVTQCMGGKVELGKYETSSHLLEIGVTSGSDITTEAAVSKLMYLLGKDLTFADLQKEASKSLRGELS